MNTAVKRWRPIRPVPLSGGRVWGIDERSGARLRSEKRNFAGVGRDAVAKEDVVRFGVAVNCDDKLCGRCGMRPMVAKNAGPVADLGNLQIVAVDEQTQTHLGRVSLFRQLNHG